MNNEQYMLKAIKLAQKGIGKTNPNPPVGAVVVKKGKIVGQGFHEYAGGPHAEIIALKKAGHLAKGADLYITLEPCSTFGKTGPCTDHIISSGIKKVFIATTDPNPKNKSKSFDILKKHNIDVIYGILQDKANELINPFRIFVTKKRPMFTLKAAQSLDGRIASCSGDSRWITSEQSRKFVHELRNQADAILIGKNTLLIDNPELNVRGIKNANTPYKIILGYVPQKNMRFNILKTHPEKVIFVIKKGVKYEKGLYKVIEANTLLELAKHLYPMSIMHVLIEGGAKAYQSFLEEKLVDKILFFIAPKIIGGDKLCIPLAYKGQKKVKDAIVLKNIFIKKIGQDVLIEGEILLWH